MCLYLETQLKNKWYPVHGLDNCKDGELGNLTK